MHAMPLSELRKRSRRREELRTLFTEVALEPTGPFRFPSGRPLALALGYQREALDAIPEGALASFVGAGNPLAAAAPASGEVVVDVGSGTGTDALLAARAVGAAGKVYGVDMTLEMVLRARAYARKARARNVSFRVGYAESLPIRKESADVVTANGLVGLCPDQGKVFVQMHRVLKSGGRVALADGMTPAEWAGARATLEAVGFTDVEIRPGAVGSGQVVVARKAG